MVKNGLKLGLVTLASGLGLGGLVPTIAHADSKTVTIGIVGSSDKPVWDSVAKTAKEKYGLTLKVKVFTDYIQPNQAVANGSIDLNSFQTLNYFNVQNKNLGNKLTTIGKTNVNPIKLYSKKLTKLSQLKKGATIAIPNDATNEERALDVLQDAKLIKYDHKVASPTVKDITSNPKHLQIKELASDQTAGSLKSVDAAVVNTGFAIDAKLTAIDAKLTAIDAKLTAKEALFTEPMNKKETGYVNYIVAQKKDANKKEYKEVVKAYQTKQTKKVIKNLYGTMTIPAWDLKFK